MKKAMQDMWLIHITFATRDEALSVARQLLEGRLIACANLHEGVTSLYRWEGALREEREVVLVAKTSQRRLQQAMETAKRLHSYDLPCIIAYPAGGGYPPYLAWIDEETR